MRVSLCVSVGCSIYVVMDHTRTRMMDDMQIMCFVHAVLVLCFMLCLYYVLSLADNQILNHDARDSYPSSLISVVVTPWPLRDPCLFKVKVAIVDTHCLPR